MGAFETVRAAFEMETYAFSSWLFLRLLGLIYLAAFVSLGIQIKGLIGSQGILPAREFLEGRSVATKRVYFLIPTLCWWNSSDRFLKGLCWAGAAGSILLVAGFLPALMLFLLWVLYLSLLSVCRVFLGYQWDVLLLETGFLAIFLAPLKVWDSFPPESPPSPVVMWLFWWLLFRLMFSSAWVKWRSGDRSWRSLTALQYHYVTQPLPTWGGWFAHQLPAGFQKFSVAAMFVIEGAIPFLFFAPAPLCHWAAYVTIFLMLLIMATGNYCFFNLLTIALALLLFSDSAWTALLERISVLKAPLLLDAASCWPLWITIPLAALILLLSADVIARLFLIEIRWPKWVGRAATWGHRFHLVNGYGLFAVMTTERPEIIIEGSDDGEEWKAYEFKWKPGDVKKRPRFCMPHQPRLDWQMWFAALGYLQHNPWLQCFLIRLLEGSPYVLQLLAKNPFPNRPPRFIRAVVYDYRFTDLKTRARTGAWWRRERRGLYSPVFSLKGRATGSKEEVGNKEN